MHECFSIIQPVDLRVTKWDPFAGQVTFTIIITLGNEAFSHSTLQYRYLVALPLSSTITLCIIILGEPLHVLPLFVKIMSFFFWVLIMFTAEKSVLIWSNVKWQSTAAVCANLCCKLLCVIQIPFIYLLVVVTNLYWLSYVNLSIRTYSLVILRTELVWNII